MVKRTDRDYEISGTHHVIYEGIARDDLAAWIETMAEGDSAYILVELEDGTWRQSWAFAIDEYEDWLGEYLEDLESSYGDPASYGVGFVGR
jgi:hypothetical protein